MLKSLQFPLAIVAHDAGAANHIIAWVKKLSSNQIYACVEGPALPLWERAFPGTRVSALPDAISNAKFLISGSGWASNLEHCGRRMARNLGIKSVATIDHWTNYRGRFTRNDEEVLPDEIWVVDDYAKKLAEREFPKQRILQMPNCYLDGLAREVQSKGAAFKKGTECNLLYVLEPIHQAWGPSEQLGEFQALDFFIKNLELLQLGSNLSIRLRPHPSDPVGKYDQWIEGQKNKKLSLDDSPILAESIAWSDVVVGCQTYAMVVALAVGRRVISSIPPWALPCVLPQAGIIKLADLVI